MDIKYIKAMVEIYFFLPNEKFSNCAEQGFLNRSLQTAQHEILAVLAGSSSTSISTQRKIALEEESVAAAA